MAAGQLQVSQTVVLGTVQFGAPYGRRHDRSALTLSEVESILDHAWQSGIRTFDTAEAYGSAPSVLGAWLAEQGYLPQAHVITKVSPEQAADLSLVESAVARFEGAATVLLLTHGPVDGRIWERLSVVCHNWRVPVGQSVYTAAEVRLAALLDAARVQAPANAVDLTNLEVAHEEDVALDARSVFLQGLLLDDPETAERRVGGAGELVRAVAELIDAAALSRVEGLLGPLLARLRPQDRLVVGVDTPEQLSEITAAVRAQRSDDDRWVDAMASARDVIRRRPWLRDPRAWSATSSAGPSVS